MATCKFCGQKFQSKQAVKAHLRGCAAYKGNLPKAAVPQALPKATTPGGFDRVTHLRQEVEAEQARLKLREVKAAHTELDEREAARAKRQREEAERARMEAQVQELARQKAEREAQEQWRREMAEEKRQRWRRELIQRAKDSAVSAWVDLVPIPEDVRAEARQGIERALAGMAVEELPEGEVREIAKGVWRRVTRPVVQAAEEAKQREDERRRKEEAECRAAVERTWQEIRERLQKNRAAAELAEKKRALVRHGQDFAREELREEDDLDWLEREKLVEQVGQELERELGGTESKAEVEDLVEEVLDEEFEEE